LKFFTDQSDNTNEVTDTWAVKKSEHGQQMTVQSLAAETCECAHEVAILVGTLHYHTLSRGNGGAAYTQQRRAIVWCVSIRFFLGMKPALS